MKNHLLLLLLTTLFSLSAEAQHMQEFNQSYLIHEKQRVTKAAQAAITRKLDSLQSQTSYLTALNAANRSLGNSAPHLAKEIAIALTTTTISSSASADTAKEDAMTSLDVLPNFTSLLGNNVLVPQIKLVGSSNFQSKNSRFYGDIRLFTSPVIQNRPANVSLFFPESSAYGISASFNYLPPFAMTDVQQQNGDKGELKLLCLYASLHYLGKSLYGVKQENGTSDTTRFTTDFTHIKLGIQVIPLVNFISFYADLNFLAPLVNRNILLKYNPDMKSGFSNFVSFGTKLFVTQGESKALNLYLDLGFVLVDDVTKTLYKTDDPVIPKLSIGSSIRF